MECHLTCGGEEAATGNFFYRKMMWQTGERDEL